MKKTIQVSGTDVHLEGEGSEVLIMIHGWPDTAELWQNQVNYFKNDFICVTFTLPGFAPGDKGKYTLDDFVQKIADVADKVAPEQKINFIVHDWGCLFGYDYAMRNPDRIKKMVSIDIGDASSKEFLNSLNLSAKLMVFTYQFTLALGWFTGSDVIHKTMAKALKAQSNIDKIHSGMGLPYAMQWFKVAGGLGNVKPIKPTFPFFYTYGTKKPFMFHTEKWAKKIEATKGNKVQAFKSGHWVMVEKADEFNKVVLEWLKEPVA